MSARIGATRRALSSTDSAAAGSPDSAHTVAGEHQDFDVVGVAPSRPSASGSRFGRAPEPNEATTPSPTLRRRERRGRAAAHRDIARALRRRVPAARRRRRAARARRLAPAARHRSPNLGRRAIVQALRQDSRSRATNGIGVGALRTKRGVGLRQLGEQRVERRWIEAEILDHCHPSSARAEIWAESRGRDPRIRRPSRARTSARRNTDRAPARASSRAARPRSHRDSRA